MKVLSFILVILYSFVVNSLNISNFFKFNFEGQFGEFGNCLIKFYRTYPYVRPRLIIVKDDKQLSIDIVEEFMKKVKPPVQLISINHTLKDSYFVNKTINSADHLYFIVAYKDNNNIADFLETIKEKRSFIVLALYEDLVLNLKQGIEEKILSYNRFKSVVSLIKDSKSIQIGLYKNRIMSNCTRKTVLHTQIFKKCDINYSYLFDLDFKTDYQNCTMNVSTLIFPPNIYVDEKTNLAVGYETAIIRELSKDANFSPNFLIRDPGIWGDVREDNSSNGIVGEVYTGKSEIALGVMWLTNQRYTYFDISKVYHYDCLTFAVPTDAGPKPFTISVAGYLLREFNTTSWILITVSIFTTTVILTIRDKLFETEEEFSLYESIVSAIVLIILLLTQRNVNKSYYVAQLSVSTLFSFWIFYSFIISTIYIGLMSTWILAPTSLYNLNKVADIVNSDLELSTTKNLYGSIKNFNDSNIVFDKLRRKITARDPVGLYLNRISRGYPMAFCRNKGNLEYMRNIMLLQNDSTFHVANECILDYPLVMITR